MNTRLRDAILEHVDKRTQKRAMSPPVFPFPSPAAGFDDPFGMLVACHERVLSRLGLLRRLGEHVDAHGADASAQSAARDILRYFDQAAPEHHRDEERHVFPQIQDPHDLSALLAQHHALDRLWATLRESLQRIAEGSGHVEESLAEEFASGYRAHIALEESRIFPGVREAMSPALLQKMSRDMAQRRGVQ